MPRIPETEIDRIKTDTDLVALIQSRGVKLKQQGKNWTGLCPFHADKKTPNLIVTPCKGLFRCMASNCGKTGNALHFVQWHDGVSFRHAFEILDSGKVAFQSTNGAKRSREPKLPCPFDSKAEEGELLQKVSKYYADQLPKNPAALDYLKSRGLDDEKMVRKFGIGFADRTLGLRIPNARRKDGAELRAKLKALGVYRKKTGREHLLGCITVPIPSANGELVQIYGRRIERSIPKENRHLYLARPLAGIFNPDALKSREIILCESILDALTFYRHGMESVTCSYGTENLTDELFDALRAAKIESVRIAYDNDKAGERAFVRDAERFIKHGIEVYRVRFPYDEDANSYALDQGGEALKQAVRNALWYSNPEDGRAKMLENHLEDERNSPEPDPELEQKLENALDEAKQKAENRPPLASDTKACTPSRSSAKTNACTPSRSSAKTNSTVPLVTNLVAKEEGILCPETVEPTENAPPAVELKKCGDYHEMTHGPRTYRVGGLEKNSSLEVLRITLRVSCEGLMHVDSLDLYRDGERRKFIERAADETMLERDLFKRDLGKLLLALEQYQEQRLNSPTEETEAVSLTATEEAEALQLLKSPNLLTKIAAAYDEAGIVGEETNKIAAYLACASRKLAKPLAVIIQSTSAAGKSTLMEAVLSFFPSEEQVKYSAMTGQSLYYLGESNLKHKILAIVEEEGAEKASYALKLLQSEGELTIASTGKDPHSGRMETQEYHVEGPVAIVLTTTSIDIDEELMNRCLVLTVDETREQTERIHQLQREARTIEGLRRKKQRAAITRLMQNAQRLIKPVEIVNPWSNQLTFTTERTRTRRDNEKYLTLIESITLLHQHQRPLENDPVAGEHIKTTLGDIETANRIAPEVLGRSLDELPPQTRSLLESIKSLIREKMKAESIEQRLSLFSRKELRDFTGWSQMQIRRHLERLHDLEYVSVRGGRNGITMKYELLTDAQESGQTYHVGLLDVAKLRSTELALAETRPQKAS